jgi:hypothetical protein
MSHACVKHEAPTFLRDEDKLRNLILTSSYTLLWYLLYSEFNLQLNFRYVKMKKNFASTQNFKFSLSEISEKIKYSKMQIQHLFRVYSTVIEQNSSIALTPVAEIN